MKSIEECALNLIGIGDFVKFILQIFSLLLLLSCSPTEEEIVPEGLIDEETMTAILTDVHLIEGARTGLTILGDTASNITDYYDAMYEKFEITEEQFDMSFKYYTQHPKVMDKMYEQVIEDLTIIEAELK